MSDKKFIRTSSNILSDEDSLEEFEAGEGNGEVYLVTVSGEEEPEYFIKTSNNEEIQQFEVTVKDMLSQYDIPLPETVETNFEGDNIFVITEAIPNEYFDWTTSNAVITFLYESADALSTIHNTTFPGLQIYFQEQKPEKIRTEFTDWRINRYISTLEGNDVYEDDIPELEMIKNWINEKTEYTPTVIHGDVHLPNILTNKMGEIQGIIDWEKASIGDPAYDLAKFECRTIDLYASQTQFSHSLLINLFRKLYGYSSELEQRVDAHKHAYGIQFRETLQTYDAFEDWIVAEEMNGPFEISCIERYEELLPYYREQSPVK